MIGAFFDGGCCEHIFFTRKSPTLNRFLQLENIFFHAKLQCICFNLLQTNSVFACIFSICTLATLQPILFCVDWKFVWYCRRRHNQRYQRFRREPVDVVDLYWGHLTDHRSTLLSPFVNCKPALWYRTFTNFCPLVIAHLFYFAVNWNIESHTMLESEFADTQPFAFRPGSTSRLLSYLLF